MRTKTRYRFFHVAFTCSRPVIHYYFPIMEYRNLRAQFNAANRSSRSLGLSIGTKIILPYFLLTLAVASIGAFVVTNLVANSLAERLQNQLVDAGQIVSEGIVRQEELRLEQLRLVLATTGLPQAVAAQDAEILAQLTPQYAINSSNINAVILLNEAGQEIYGWQQTLMGASDDGTTYYGRDFSSIPAVQSVLRGEADERGDRYVFLSDSEEGLLVYTAAPVFFDDRLVGAAIVGAYTRNMMLDLTLSAIAHVTFYDTNGHILDTTLGGGQIGMNTLYGSTTDEYQEVVDTLTETPERYETVTRFAAEEVPIRYLHVLDQDYALAYGDWRLRDQSFGMFSVALPSNFLVNTIATSRSQVTAVFTLAVVGVFIGGYLIARRITDPIEQLVQTAEAVTAGDLDRRSGIHKKDEVGKLARAFDQMTESLARRNRDLKNKTSELEAILNSIADGVIVLDKDEQMVSLNPAAQNLLTDMSHDFMSGPLQELSFMLHPVDDGESEDTSKRYQIGNRILSASSAPMQSTEGEDLGSVIVLRDITREAEAENLKAAFITSISHELRTPLTVIKLNAHMIEKSGNGHLQEQQRRFVHKINKESENLEHHINQLINMSEIQAGTVQMHKQPVDLLELLQEVGAKWTERFENKQIVFRLILPETAVSLHADHNQLSWAIENLLSNALNYTQEGGSVTLEATEADGQAVISVSDNGIGIAAADQPHLFERFFRASNNVNFSARGIGLGLFVTRSIVEMHEGQVSVESAVGAGSTFTIMLPLSVAEPS